MTPQTVFVGQQVLYGLDLYTQSDISSMNPHRLPDFQGFWVHEVPQPEQLKPVFTELGGDRFGRVSILERVVFPLRPGKLQIASATFYLSVKTSHIVDARGLRDKVEEIERRSNGLALDVRPLPSGAPADFSGAVGQFQLTAELDRTQVNLGEALQLTVTLAGEGNLQSLADFQLPELSGAEAFEPAKAIQQEVEGHKVVSKRSWRYPIKVGRLGPVEVPALSFSYFDPKQQTYKRSKTAPLEVIVVEAPAEKKLFDPVALTRSNTSRTLRGLALGLLAALVAFWSRRRWRTLKPSQRSSIRASRRPAKEATKQLDAISLTQDRRRLAADVEAFWNQFLVSQGLITRPVPPASWQKQVEAPKATKNALHQLADDLDYLKKAPELAHHDELAKDLIAQSKLLLRRF